MMENIGRNFNEAKARGKHTSSKRMNLPIETIKRIFSGISLTLSIILFLIGLSEIIIYLLDRIDGLENYVSWEKSFIIPWILSAILFAIFLTLNIRRILPSKKNMAAPVKPGKIEIPDLD